MTGFRTIPLRGFRNEGHRNVRSGDSWLWSQAGDTAAGDSARATELADLAGLPTGRQHFWGIPFDIEPDPGTPDAVWVVMGRDRGPAVSDMVTIPIGSTARFILFCHFTDAVPAPDMPHELIDDPGTALAEYTIRYRGGEHHVRPIRNRFEINPYQRPWGRQPFGAVEHLEMLSYPEIGADQQGLTGIKAAPAGPNYIIMALENPKPETPIEEIELRAVADRVIAVAAITLCDHVDNPLKRSPLTVIRAEVDDADGPMKAELDLGHVAGTYPISGRVDGDWTAESDKGAGSPDTQPTRVALIEAYGAPSASLRVTSGSSTFSATWGELVDGKEVVDAGGGARFRVVHDERAWVHVKVHDRQSGKPTAARVHFRGPHGEYLAPHGHQREINTNWCEDLGGDLKLGNTGYAYVDGGFQIELPVGDIFVEVVKGFEYEPTRQKIRVESGQRELTLEVNRWTKQTDSGYFSGDTHVHFLDPSTAVLEAEAEDLNVVNVLAAQWGRLFTDTERFTGGLAPASTEETLVWVGSENRHHMLGHMSLLGITSPIYPLSSGGPTEAYLGGPEEILMAEWADAAHEQGALVVTPHFPAPHCEIAVDIALRKIDAAEIKYFPAQLKGESIAAWYRYLNCGYRLPAVGGTDKMTNSIPVGGVRTYAHLDDDGPLTHERWRNAIKAGRTFTSTGPLMDFTVEGLPSGGSLTLSDGGTVEIAAAARSALPFTRLEVVANGRIIADTGTDASGRSASLHVRHEINESCWLAARCYGEIDLWHNWVNKVAAHTSPVYVTVGGREVFSPSDAAYVLTLIEGGITYLNEIASYRDEAKRARHIRIFESGKEAVHRKLHDHNLEH